MKLATTMLVILRVQQTPARFQYKTKCLKLQSAFKTNEPTVRQRPPQDLSSRGSRAYSTVGPRWFCKVLGQIFLRGKFQSAAVLRTTWTEREGMNLNMRRVQDDAQYLLTPHGSQEGIIEPDPSISGVSAEESSILECDPADAALTLVIGLIARGLLDAIWDRKEPIIQVAYNDKNSSYIPKKVVAKCKNEAQLESFTKKAFDVPANKSVKLAFKPTGEQREQRFQKDYIAEQLSIAVAVYVDDSSDA